MLLSDTAIAKNVIYNYQKWTISVETRTGEVSVQKDGRTVIHRSCATWGVDSTLTAMGQAGRISSKGSDFEDQLGKGRRITVEGHKGNTHVIQDFRLYDGKDWLTTQVTVTDRQGVALNIIRPLNSTAPYSLFPLAGNAVVSIPFDNDAWVRYCQSDFGAKARESYEVSALLNKDTREGLIIGSIDHDTWKTGIQTATSGIATVDTLIAGGGASSVLTRDTRNHGQVKGTTVKSPRIMIGMFDDWRTGMETYGDLCTAVAPVRVELVGQDGRESDIRQGHRDGGLHPRQPAGRRFQG